MAVLTCRAFEPSCGAQVMGNLYGSLWLTTVIQIKSTYDGAQADGSPFNTLAYNDRGWCCFEEGAAKLAAYHRRKAKGDAKSRRTPKLIDVSSVGEPQVVDVSMQHPSIDELENAIQAATFTGSGDKEVVVTMLKEYNSLLAVGRRVAAMQIKTESKTLGDTLKRWSFSDLSGALISTVSPAREENLSRPAAPFFSPAREVNLEV